MPTTTTRGEERSEQTGDIDPSALVARVLSVRRATMRLVEPLELEDWGVQSMPDASPAKWHLAHTTWFFERFVLRALGLPPVYEHSDYLFNSYYESVGARQPRSRRGLLTRPTVREVVAYRASVDARLEGLVASPRFGEIASMLELGANHEEQHQELILTDIKHLFAQNPLLVGYRDAALDVEPHRGLEAAIAGLSWHRFDGGQVAVGHDGRGFAFDNEGPRHDVIALPFELASRLVTCAEFQAFIDDGGYERPELWLSEGWQWTLAQRADAGGRPRLAPMYWLPDEGAIFTLRGRRARSAREPVCHVTYYEADAYARWANARLPREAEWEIAARLSPITSRQSGGFLEDDALHPLPAAAGPRISQLFGDAWEWTESAYAPYPGFRPLPGALGEYNGKFMVSQMVLRGGSCATPRHHIRATYRNFFPPSAAWQFSGIRLARDVR